MEDHSCFRRWMRIGSAVIFILVLVNFTVFWVVTLLLGGTPCEIDQGHYYLCSHGQVTQVSREAYLYAYYHERIVWFSVLLIPVVILLDNLSNSTKKPNHRR